MVFIRRNSRLASKKQLKRKLQHLHQQKMGEVEEELSNKDFLNIQLKKINLQVSQIKTDLKAKLK